MEINDTVYKRGNNSITTTIESIEDIGGRCVITDGNGKQYTKAAFAREWSLVSQ